MINPRELMLGNTVEAFVEGGLRPSPMKVVAVGGTKIYLEAEGKVSKFEHANVHPIPLTAEILEKNGFKISSQDVWTNNVSGNAGTITLESMYGYYVFGVDRCFWQGVHIAYVHQLQNAYFMLTKKNMEVEI